MKRTREITITHYRRWRAKKNRATTVEGCPVCLHGSDLIAVAAAIQSTSISRSILDAWIANQQVHVT